MSDIVFVIKKAETDEKKVVEIPEPIAQHISVNEGDYVKIIYGENTTVAKVKLNPEGSFKTKSGITTCVVNLDGYTMKLLEASVGDAVLIEPANVKPAKRIVIAPSSKLTENDKAVIHRVLDGKVLMKGDEIPIVLPNAGKTLLKVIKVEPNDADGVEVLHDTTEIVITQPMKVKGGLVIDVTFDDIGAYDDVKQKVRDFIIAPLMHPEIYKRTGFAPPKGVLISGPSGSGKTMLVKAIVFETDANLIYAHASDIIGDSYTSSKAELEDLFRRARKNAPAILCIEDIDLIAPRKDEMVEAERKLTSALIALMDRLDTPGVMVIGTTTSPDSIDPALKRAGRFDKEIEIPVPDLHARLEILKTLTKDLPTYIEFSQRNLAEAVEELHGDLKRRGKYILGKISLVMRPSDIEEIVKKTDPELYEILRDKILEQMLMKVAKRTHGFVGADLETLVREAIISAINRLVEAGLADEEGVLTEEGVKQLIITQYDFEEALKHVEPSALKEILIEVPEVHWDDIGGYDEVKQLLREVVEWPLVRPKLFEATGISPPKGVLLYGPPGTGKTLLAKAVATESGANFIAVKGPEVLSKWVGEGERKIREIFRKARQVAPTIIFFDEIDSIGQRRGADKAQHVDSMINQLLTEMDGLEERGKVIVIAATNRPDILDPALLRPGRFDRLILIPAPDEKARLEILKVHTRKVPLDRDVNLKELAKKTEGYSGADLEALVREATIKAIRRVIEEIPPSATIEEIREKVRVTAKDFEDAMKRVKPSISKDMMHYYERMEKNLKASVSSKFTNDYGKFW